MRERQPKPSSSSWIVSVVLHIVLGAGLIRVLMMPSPLSHFLQREKRATIPAERIGFIRLPAPNPNQPPTAGRSGGDGRPETPNRAEPAPLVAPAAVPTGVAPSTASSGTTDGGSGPVVGAGGRLRGVVPTYTDPRLWAPPSPVAVAPKTHMEKLDSALTVGIERAKDSMAIAARADARPNWVTEKGGKKYGVDSTGSLWVAGVRIPIPVGVATPPGQMERSRVMANIRREILEQSQRRLTEDEFRETVKKIRERKDRERAEARAKAETKQISTAAPDR